MNTNNLVYNYFNCTIELVPWRNPNTWTFDIICQGERIRFRGIPNTYLTKRSALKRAWYRAKWLDNGTYHKHYK